MYYRSEDETQGLLPAEGGRAEMVLALKPSDRAQGPRCPRACTAEAATLAHREAGEGLVVIYANKTARVEALVTPTEDHPSSGGEVGG